MDFYPWTFVVTFWCKFQMQHPLSKCFTETKAERSCFVKNAFDILKQRMGDHINVLSEYD